MEFLILLIKPGWYALPVSGTRLSSVRRVGTAILAIPLLTFLASAAHPANLRCEYRADPMGIDTPRPRLSWVIASPRRGEWQTAYRVLVASEKKLLTPDRADLWDSGKVTSDQSIQVEYGGKPLSSGARCYWKVRIWDREEQPSPWSPTAQWTMGLLRPDDWRGLWIEPNQPAWLAALKKAPADQPLANSSLTGSNPPAYWVRKVFSLEAAPQRAIGHVNVMGYYELYVNGRKVDASVLSPAVSDLSQRSLYRSHDLTGFLRRGPNCIGLWLDAGWHRPGPLARMQLDLLVDGKPARVATDGTWTCAPSTHTRIGEWKWNNMGGESVDARRDLAGWCDAEFRADDWIPVRPAPPPNVAATSQSCPPNRLGQRIPLNARTRLDTHLWELDFGTNLTGWLRLRLPRLRPGQRVVMHYADKRFQSLAGDDTPAGRVRAQPSSQKIFQTPRGPVGYQTFNQVDEFISAGKPGEQFCSKFNYHGFRYVIVDGLPAAPAAGDAEALLIESDLEPAGAFACSNELFNRIHAVNLWTMRCLNLGGYYVDCPHRERKGYGDGQVAIESLMMNRHAPAFYEKWAGDWLDGQDGDGFFPHTAPNDGGGGGPAWGGTACVLPGKLHLYYGDRRLLDRAYEPMRRYGECLERRCANGILRAYGGRWDFIGDWVPPGRGMDTDRWPPKPAAEFFNNCYRVYLWDLLAQAAEMLGRTADARRFRDKLAEIRPLIHTAFYDEPAQHYVLDEQAYYVMPLMTGVAPEALRATLFRKLETNLRTKNHGHLDTGMLGTYFLLQHLQETGRDDLIFEIMNQTTYPGWGYMLSQGATTFWEQWNGFWSQIHSCFTSPGGWFYQGLAGLRPDPAGPGFKKIIIRPAPVGDVRWVKAHYDSVHGRIVCDWKRDAGRFTLHLTLPANTTATVWLPAADAASVRESGQPVTRAEGVKFLRTESDRAVFAVQSGKYVFTSTLPDRRSE
jgi:alpha-L-rhamnosidase